MDSKAVGDRLAAEMVELDPLTASDWGIPTAGLPSLDPEWFDDRRALFAWVLKQIPDGPADAGGRFLRERCSFELDWIESEEAHSELQAALDSPLFRIRHCFDEMPQQSPDEWERLAARLEQVPRALRGFVRTLETHRATAPPAPRAQVTATCASIDGWTGTGNRESVFERLVSTTAARIGGGLEERLCLAARAAAESFDGVASYLRETYMASAVESHRVGPERFSLWSRRYAGSVVGADDYEWAIERLAQANSDQSDLRAEVGRSGPARLVEGEANLREWVEATIATAAERLAATATLDVAGLPSIVARTMDDTTGGQAYYSPSSEDGERPATVWIGAGGGPHEVEYFKTVVLHESIPGHHIEASFQRGASDLNRFQRLVYIPGHSEGWGLYAERLADEVGLLDTPRERLGFRGSQALRLVSLLIDVGLHNDLEPPADLRPYAGDRWSIEGAVRLVAAQGLDQPTAEYWVTNMAGRPGHRASYVAGERAWLDARAESSRRGETLQTFHSRMLNLGPLGIDQMRFESCGPQREPA